MITCRNKLCKWRGYGRQLQCFFCHRLPGGCFCTGVEMFRFDGLPGKSKQQDLGTDRAKLTYFLLCPGPCGGRLGVPIKPRYEHVARYQVTCTTCKSECSNPSTQQNQWRYRIQQALCSKCNKTFKTCACQAPYEIADMPLHTQKGIMLRAAYRTRKRREGVWFCGVCYEVMDVENISEREWETKTTGEAGGAQLRNMPGTNAKSPGQHPHMPALSATHPIQRLRWASGQAF